MRETFTQNLDKTREQKIFESIEKLCDGSGRLAHLRKQFPEKADKLNEMIDSNTEEVKKLTGELQMLMRQQKGKQ